MATFTFVGSSNAHLVAGENLRLLLAHEAEILITPRYFFSEAGSAGGPFHGGGRLGIGHLLQLWKRPGWLQRCPKCRGAAHLNILGLIPGSSFWRAGCANCDERVEGYALERDGNIAQPDQRFQIYPMFAEAGEIWHARINAPKVIPGERPKFSLAHGLTGKWTPDLVVEPPVEPLPMAALLDVLRGGLGSVAIRDPSGHVRYGFHWLTETLRDPNGRQIFRRDGERVFDHADRLAYFWDSRYLCDPTRRYLLETRRERDGSTAFDLFRGLAQVNVSDRDVRLPGQAVLFKAEHEIPALFGYLTWKHAQEAA